MTSPLSASLTIGGSDYSAYVETSTRSSTLENPGATLVLILNSSFPYGSVDPWDDLVYSENGTLVFTGYVTHVVVRRPTAAVEVQATDTFYRCQKYFIPGHLYTGGSDAMLSSDKTFRTINYYVGYVCGLAGVAYSINDSAGVSYYIKSDVELGLQTVADVLVRLCGIAQWCMRVNPAGVLQFDHIPRPSTPDYTITTGMTFENELNDTDTKNAVKVWGFDNTPGSAGGEFLYSGSRTVTGVNETRTMVYAIPEIQTLAQAAELGQAALDQWASLEYLLRLTLVGNPSTQVGESIEFMHSLLITSGSYLDTITDFQASVSQGGYKHELTAGRRAYRYPYWPVGQAPPPPPVQAIMVGILENSFAGQHAFATTNWNDASPTWYGLGGSGLNNDVNNQVITDKAHGSRVFANSGGAIYTYADVTQSALTWITIPALSGTTIPDAIVASGGGSVFTSPDSWSILSGSLSVDPLNSGHIAFQVYIHKEISFVSSYSGIFTLLSNDAGTTVSVADGATIIDDFAFPATTLAEGSTSFESSGVGSSNVMVMQSHFTGGDGIARTKIGSTYGFGPATDTGNDILEGDFEDTRPAYHTRGGVTQNRVIWMPDRVYAQWGAIAAGNHTVTANTGLTAPNLYTNSIAVSQSGNQALGLDQSNHVWRVLSGNSAWTDLGNVGFSNTSKGLVALPDDANHFAACGARFLETTDGGATWADKGGSHVSTPNYVSLDYMGTF